MAGGAGRITVVAAIVMTFVGVLWLIIGLATGGFVPYGFAAAFLLGGVLFGAAGTAAAKPAPPAEPKPPDEPAETEKPAEEK